MLNKPIVLIVSPYLADANNGNWRTARRWQQLLEPHYHVSIDNKIDDATIANQPDVVIALHAKRSHAAILRSKQQMPHTPLIVVLTGTDLYRDIAQSEEAQQSLVLADALIVLQEDAIQHVSTAFRRKTHIVFQSATTLKPAVKAKNQLNCVIVGHLRHEKSPETVFQAARLLANHNAANHQAIRFTHIGEALDDSLADEARQLNSEKKNYQWVGPLPHGLTRAAIKRAHLLIHPSIMEGGANVIVEAITAGTAVVASKMSGNVGMLGVDYAGYFDVGDAAALAHTLTRCVDDANLLTRLNTACKARAALFTPAEETRRLQQIISALIE
jgi:putative glycosyltransferase (TIGR04348 family)